MENNKSFLLRMATAVSSREAGFVIATICVLVQIFHTFHVFLMLTDIDNMYGKNIQGLMAAFGLSFALLYFVIKSGIDHEKYKNWLWFFTSTEVFINLYYWVYSLVVEPTSPEYFHLVAAIPLSFVIPFTIKAYGGEIDLMREVREQEKNAKGMQDFVNEYKEKLDSSILSLIERFDKQSIIDSVKADIPKQNNDDIHKELSELKKTISELQEPTIQDLSGVEKKIDELEIKIADINNLQISEGKVYDLFYDKEDEDSGKVLQKRIPDVVIKKKVADDE